MSDWELMKIEQALRLARHTAKVAKQGLTLQKLEEALEIVQAIPHSRECTCDYCQERGERAAKTTSNEGS